jgi:uroporphyrinogen-III decarboxylase
LQDYLDHFEQLFEFSKRTGRKVPVMFGLSNVSNICDWMGVQNVLKWLVSEPNEKVHRLLRLVADYAYAGIEACRPYVDDGVEFVCIFGGSRTWGPKQVAEFGIYDKIYAEKVAKLFKYPMHHLCGNNVPYTYDVLLKFPNVAMQFDQSMMQLNWSWAKWCEWAARMASGKQCLANSPTTQVAVHGKPEAIRTMIKEFIAHTTPYTTAIVMPGCQLSTATPTENVRVIVETAREYGKYPECKNVAKPEWEEDEFQESVKKLVGKYSNLTSTKA